MSVSGFERWRHFCEPFQFSDALAEKNGHKRPPGVTFCTAHMGTGWPPRASAPKPGVSACPRQLHTVQTLPIHLERQRAMREQIRAMAADTDVFLFQEVIDGQAIQELFDGELATQFEIISLHSVLTPDYPVAQLLGAAVRKIRFSQIRHAAFLPLAQKTEEGHQVRPGQHIELITRQGKRVSILNVHLKAGCNQFDLQDPWGESRSGNPDKPTQSCDPWAQISRLTQRQNRVVSCNALRRQLEPLEAWIDGKAAGTGLPTRGAHFIVAGDFNRRLHAELSPRKGAARTVGATTDPFDDKAIRWVWPELNDGEPAESRMRLATSRTRPADVSSNQEPAQAPTHVPNQALNCKHLGIDHFVVSQALAGRQGERLGPLQVLPLPIVKLAQADPYGQDRLPLSDHCPHKIQIQWE